MEVTISSLMTSVGDVFTSALGWVGDIAQEIVAEPLFVLFCVAVPLCGIAFAFTRRLISAV